MSKHRRSFTPAQKMEIINYYKAHGMAVTRRHYEIASSVISRWLERFERHGEAGLKNKVTASLSEVEREVVQLRRDIREYKQMVAERDLAIRIKDELLKKTHLLSKIEK